MSRWLRRCCNLLIVSAAVSRADPVDDKYGSLGGPGGFLGSPTTEELWTPNSLGRYRHYRNGSIYWKTVFLDAWEVHGEIRAKWAKLGWENSFLGFPVSDEFDDPLNPGARINHFEYGAIVWTPSPTTGDYDQRAHEIHGAIYQRFRAIETVTPPGLLLTDELPTPDKAGRFNHFSEGSIYWSPTTGAHEVFEPIKSAWAAIGWERSSLGYPVDGPLQLGGATTQDFQGGVMHASFGLTRISPVRSSVLALSGGSFVDIESFNAGSLQDGDRVGLGTNGARFPDAPITVTLVAGAGITWWKSISIWNTSRGKIQEVSTQDGRHTASMQVSPSILEDSQNYLVLSKAKAFGAHTDMYWLTRTDRLIGNDVTFTWTKD